MSVWIWSSWETIGFVVLSTAAIYLTTLAAVRIAGRRSISQLSAFDAVVTIALGSTLASTALGPSATYAQGATVIATLLVLQLIIATARQRSTVARRILDFAPEQVVTDGELTLPSGPFTSQLSEDELRSLLRQRGIFDLDDVAIVLLEPSGGSISVRRLRADEHPPET